MTTSSADGVVGLAAVVGVPVAFYPLQEFEVVSERVGGRELGRRRGCG